MTDKEKFEKLGIYEGVPFKIRELTGIYIIDLSERRVLERVKANQNYVVKGLYEHLLDGTWHKQ